MTKRTAPVISVGRELFVAEVARNVTLVRRYPFELAGAVILLAGAFFGLLYGARFIGVSSIADNPDLAMVSYGCWLLLVCGFSNLSAEISAEANTGTLPNVFQSAYPILVILAIRALVGAAVALGVAAMVMLVMAVGTGAHIHPSGWALVAVLTLLVSATGMGLVVAGMAVVLKRMNLVLIPMQLMLMALAITRFEDYGAPAYHAALTLPAVPSLAFLRITLVQGASADAWLLLACVLNAAVYLLVGMVGFGLLANAARRRGSVAEY